MGLNIMPDFDLADAMDPEADERRERAAYAEQYRQREAAQQAEVMARQERVAARAARLEPVLRRMTRRDSWTAWVWPEEVPDYLAKHVTSRGVLSDLAAILDLIQRVFDLDSDNESDVVAAICDHHDFDMDAVERCFRDHEYEIVEDAESYARDYAENQGEIPTWLEQYIDYEAMGKDLLNDQTTTELGRGKILIIRD